MSKQSNSSSGISYLAILGIVFITLRLCKVIDWSWWWVLLPFYGGIGLVVLLLIILAFLNTFK